ncbi:MAG: helix-turn-helix transcriptional regulator [Sphingobium sp.]
MPIEPIRAPHFAQRLKDACSWHHDYATPRGQQARLRRAYNQKTDKPISPETVSRWFKGEVQTSRERIVTLAEVLNVNVNWLETGNGKPQKDNSLLGGKSARDQNCSDNIPIPLRPGLTVSIHNLPMDLKPAEAERIANIVIAYAVGEP